MAAGRNIVLVVDDEPIVVRAITIGLAAAGFRVIVAENGVAGLDVYVAMQSKVCLVIADVILPGMSGPEMVKAIRNISPDVKVLLISGYSDSITEQAGVRDFPFLRKPFLIQDLMIKVKQVCGEPEA